MDVIRFCRTLPSTYEGRRISGQLMSAGTAVGAAYRAVCRCKSDPDFISKLGTCIEEADESGYWMELAVEAGLTKPADAGRLVAESDELTRIFVASRETVRARLRAKHQARQRARASSNHESRIKNHES